MAHTTDISGTGTRSKPFIVACIPAYNEERTIAKVIIRCSRHVDKVIVCDDGSKDMTAEIAEALGAEVIRHERNMGKGAAIRSLFERARKQAADIVITIDGDGQHDPDDIPLLIRALAEADADIVVGSRFLTNRTGENVPKYRYIGNKLLNVITSVQGITDTQSGFRAYSRKAIGLIQPAEMGFAVDSEIIYKAVELNLKIAEVPIDVDYKVPKPSKRGPIFHALDAALGIIKQMSIRHPLIFYGVPALIALFIGLIFWIWTFQVFAATRQVITNITLVAIGATIVGLMLLTTAVILWVLVSLIRETR